MAERVAARVSNPSYQAYQILHVAFTVAPVVAGLDKFTHFLSIGTSRCETSAWH